MEVDQQAGARLAADHLAALGRRRIGTISGPQDRPAGQVRLAGFLEALATHGIEDVACAEGDFTHLGGAAAMRRLLEEQPGLDGVFIASDLMALGALPVLQRAGRDVPSDVAVVGFDDSSAAAACDPPLTTVRQPVEEMAAEMARLLLKQIGGPGGPSPSVVFPPTLVRRRSA